MRTLLRFSVGLLLLAISAKIKANDEDEAFHPTAKITGVDVDKISQNGAVITIYGHDFAKNFIGSDGHPDDNIGNKVILSDEWEEIECKTPVERTWLLQNPQASSSTKVTAECGPRKTFLGDGWYTLTMYVDTKKVRDTMTVQYRDDRTPTITEAKTKRWVRVEDVVEIRGKFYTGEYGFKPDNALDNDNEQLELRGIFIGPNECQMNNDAGDKYGFALDNEDGTKWGDLQCKLKGTYIGAYEASYFVSTYGWSRNESEAVQVDSYEEPFVFHTLPSISSLSYNQGAETGSQFLDIAGTGFDQNAGQTQVLIGGQECSIVDGAITSTNIQCQTPAKSSDADPGYWMGSAGLKYELWQNNLDFDPGTLNTWDDIKGVHADSGPAEFTTILEQGPIVNEAVNGETSGFTARLTGFFKAPYSGDFKFYAVSSDKIAVFFSKTGAPEDAERIIKRTNSNTDVRGTGSDDITLVKGQTYYFAAIHRHDSGTTAGNKLRISLSSKETRLTNDQTYYSDAENQIITLKENKRDEKQSFTVSGDITSQFYFTMQGHKSLVTFDLEAGQQPESESPWTPENFMKMLEARCIYNNDPDFDVEKDTITFKKSTGETDSPPLPGQAGNSRSYKYEPYCGAGLLLNQYVAYWVNPWNDDAERINLLDFAHVCFAYRGQGLHGNVRAYYRWGEIGGNNRKTFVKDIEGLEPSEDTWKYTCINLEQEFRESKADPDIDFVELYRLDIPYSYGDRSWSYIDDLRFTSQALTIERTAPLPHSDMLAEDIELVYDETANSFEFTYNPNQYTCPSQRFPLFGIWAGTDEPCELTKTDGSTTMAKGEIDAYLADEANNEASFRCMDWPADASITIKREEQMSLKMSGSYSLTYGANELSLPIYSTKYDIYPKINQAWNYECEIHEWDNCWNTQIQLKWTCEGGDKDEITINSDNIVTDGTTLDFNVRTDLDGGLFMWELGPDFFYTFEENPQVQIIVNDYSAWCDVGTDCSYTYQVAAETPTISSVVLAGTEVTIIGTGFTTDDDTLITFNDDPILCSAITVSATEIVCTPSILSAGQYEVNVIVKSKGISAFAPQSRRSVAANVIDVELVIDTVSPSTGLLGGGTPITIQGSGFPDIPRDLSITINGGECGIISSTPVLVTCSTPASDLAGTFDVVASFNGKSTTFDGFTYDDSNAPSVSSLSPTESSTLKGGEQLTITGSFFGTDKGDVTLCDKECKVVTWTDTEIVCETPSNPDGECVPVVDVPNVGFAAARNAPAFVYKFRVTNITPSAGSVLGGTIVKIEGEGFGNNECNELEIVLGEENNEDYTCNKISCTDTEIICQVERTQKTIFVRNQGSHALFGYGYKWSPQNVEALPGDKIQWIWTFGSSAEDIGVNVQQVSGPSTSDYDGVGFFSARSKEGSFSKAFYGLGTLFYSSSEVQPGNDQLRMSGSVTIKMPTAGEVPLSVRINDNQNQQIIAISEPCTDCTGTLQADPDCTEGVNSDDLGSNADGFKFKLIDDIAQIDDVQIDALSEVTLTADETNRGPLQGQTSPTFTLTGTNFGATPCENKVSLGDIDCTVTEASATELKCTVDSPLDSETSYEIQLTKTNIGRGVVSTNKAEYFTVSYVSAMSPNTGSLGGGNILTLTGTGLISHDDTVLVVFIDKSDPSQVQHECKVLSKTNEELTCEVPDAFKSRSSAINARVLVAMSSLQRPPASVGDESVFDYTFDPALTASVTALDKTEIVAGGETVTITGSGFGIDSSKVTVNLVKAETLSRKKRSIDLHDDHLEQLVLHKPLNRRVVSKFYEDMMNANGWDQISWRVASGGEDIPSILRSDLALNPISTGHNVIFEDYHEGESHLLEEEGYLDFVNRHRRSTIQMNLRRHRRSILPKLLMREVETVEPSSYQGTVNAVTDTSIEAAFVDVPAGDYVLVVSIEDAGNAVSSGGVAAVASVGSVDAISPSIGSTYGNQEVTITGTGFHNSDNTEVTIGGNVCSIVSVTIDTIVCNTGSNSGTEALAVAISVQSGDASITTAVTYSYSTSDTPTITVGNPLTVNGGETVTLTGTLLDTDPSKLEVTIGGSICTIVTSSETSIECEVPVVPGGTPLDLAVLNKDLGSADINGIQITVNFEVTGISPIDGSQGGGTLVTISGFGFDTDGEVTIQVCSEECKVEGSYTATEIQCRTPKTDSTDAETVCSVTVMQGELLSANSPADFTYKADLTPMLTNVSPKFGGGGGGTQITITGTGFEDSGNKVSIDGVVCDIKAESSTTIVCDTNRNEVPGYYPIDVEVGPKGYAKLPDDDSGIFRYVNFWSSIWSWGGLPPPSEGQLAAIPPGIEMVLDITTPVLKSLILNGGTLVYDRDQNGLTLNAEYILIVNDGSLQIGSEAEPYENEATIMLHGHTRCIELPIYGCKVLGVRKGSLELHGKPVVNTWTRLAQTADAGDMSITVEDDVSDWQVGDEIVIPSTGHRHSMGENEKLVIASIDADGKTINLESALAYKHISLSQTFGDHVVETRAEVGRLTRNVKYQGSQNREFFEDIPACDKGFDSNQFATQSCFRGKFGEELGSDEFGAVTLYAVENRDQNEAQIHLSYVEFFWVGQAFRVGRYPVHFHMMGDVSGSYVKGCAIHNSFNRAMTIHGITGVLAERIVTYDIKGLSFFIEDGKEENNVIRHNLAVYTKQSSSLLNPDVTPAAFWVVNPNNELYGNAAAGGTHFGFWYRIQRHPDGPSEDSNYCSNNVPLGVFRDNSAHTFGWYGIWVFSMAGYLPMDGTPDNGYCDGTSFVPARYENFLAWRCERGAEVVFGGPLQFHDFKMLDNEKAGMEFVEVDGGYGENGPGTFNGIVVGHSDITADEADACTHEGVIGPKLWYLTVDGTEFYNFDKDNCYALGTCSQCTSLTAAFPVQVKNLKFVNSPNKVVWKWVHGGSFVDTDGSLTGTADNVVIPSSPLYSPTACASDDVGEFSGGSVPGSVCDSTFTYGRMAWNNPVPDSLLYDIVVMTTEHGTQEIIWRKKDITHKQGWNGLFPQNTILDMQWKNYETVYNMTYDLSAFNLGDEGDYFAIRHGFNLKPDRVIVTPGADAVRTNETELDALPDDTAFNGQFYYDETDKQLTYVLAERDPPSSRRKRGLGLTSFPLGEPRHDERRAQLRAYRCYFDDCIPPPPPSFPRGEPGKRYRWSNATDWEEIAFKSNGEITKPTEDGLDFQLPGEVFMIVDEALPEFGQLIINAYATLAFEDTMDHVVNCKNLFIRGGEVLAGKYREVEDVDPIFTHKLTFNLLGGHTDDDYQLPAGPKMGAKSIGVFGRLTLKSDDTQKPWVKLGAAAAKDQNTIVLNEAVDWTVGSEIFITSTSYIASEAEKHTIATISGDGLTITTTDPLVNDHTHDVETVGDVSVTMTAEVGLLTRKIQIIGAPYAEQADNDFGCRVTVGRYVADGQEFIGNARLENVEFKNCGQRGFTAEGDYGYSLVFEGSEKIVNATNDDLLYDSKVSKCSFNYNYNIALGSFSTNEVPFEDNVIYRALDKGIEDEGTGNKWHRNLVGYVLFTGVYLNQAVNFDFEGCFHMQDAIMPELIGNVAAGCERGGIVTQGEPCTSTDSWTANAWTDNEVHGSMHGLRSRASSAHSAGTDCAAFNNFLVWKVYDYGIFVHSPDSIVLDNVKVLGSTVGFLPIPFAPPALSHDWVDKTVTVQNSLFVGMASNYDCAADGPITKDAKPTNWPHHGGDINSMGVMFPSFASSAIPSTKPHHVAKSYNAIRGTMFIKDVTFANYAGVDSCGKKHVAIRTNPDYEDMQMPIITTGIAFVGVDENNKVFFDNPSLGAVNPSDCVDMPCDAKRKVLIIDEDGSFTEAGSYSTIIPDNSFQWEGDASYGLGYYRVPQALETNVDGTAVDLATTYPNVGVVGNGFCTKNSDWNAKSCSAIKHRLLVIESMDKDTEVRRLSPISVSSTVDGHIDLINGPQDHGWCFGYTCQERISTFHAMVAIGQTFEIHMTSTPPQHLRYHLLNSADDEYIVVKFWYPKRQQLEIFINGIFKPAKNGEYDGDAYDLLPPNDDYIPDPADPSVSHGDNYYDPGTGHLYIAMSGSPGNDGIIDVKQKPVVVFRFGGTVTNEEFFNPDNIVANFANLLGVDPKNIRVAEIVREGSRKKRDTSREFDIEVSVGSTDEGTDEENFEATNALATQVEAGLQKSLAAEMTVESVAMTQAPDPPREEPSADEKPTEPIPEPENPDDLTPIDQVRQQEEEAAQEATLVVRTVPLPTALVIEQNNAAISTLTGLQEWMPQTIKFHIVDQNSALFLNINDDPWTAEITVASGPGALDSTSQQTSCEFATDGYCSIQFALDKETTSGNLYSLSFTVKDANGVALASVPVITFADLEVDYKPMEIRFTSQPPPSVREEEYISVTLSFWDTVTDAIADTATVSIPSISCELKLVQGPTETSIESQIISTTTGNHEFTNLQVGEAGAYLYKAVCAAPYDGPIQSNAFIVQDMEIRFTSQPPSMIREMTPFSVALSFWNPVTKALANVAPLPSGVSCQLKLNDGSTETVLATDTMSDSTGDLTFSGVTLNDALSDAYLIADCDAPYGQIQSQTFSVYDLEIRFVEQPPSKIRELSTFAVQLGFWDPVTNAAVTSGSLPSGVSCEIELSDGDAISNGVTTGTMSDTTGILNFADLSMEDEHLNVQIVATCAAPYGTVQSQTFSIHDLEVRFTTQPPVATRKGGTYSVTLSFWDPVTDAVAVSPLPSGVSCELKSKPVDGSTETSIDSGSMDSGELSFDDLSVADPGNYVYVADCDDPYDAESREFGIYDWPETILVRRQSFAVEITAAQPYLDSTINTLNQLKAEGVDAEIVIETVDSGPLVPEDKTIDLTGYEKEYNPVCHLPDVPPNRIIALGYQEPNVFEILEADIPTEPTDNVIVFETEPQPPSKFRKIAKIIYKYGAFVFWLGILFVMVLALGSAAKSHKHRFRYDCDCSNETYLPSCKNCLNGTMSWFEVPLGAD